MNMMQRALYQLFQTPGSRISFKEARYANFQSVCAFSNSAISNGSSPTYHGTTILCVRKNGKVCMMGDGQVSLGNMVVKPNARKIRRIHPKTVGGKTQKGSEGDDENSSGGTIVGFAGSTADAFTLLERLEGKLDEYPGQLARSCVELAKGWRTDKYLRRLEASLLVADENVSLEITGNGDVLESHDKVLAVGSGSPFAIAAARALQDVPELSAEEVARKSMEIASDMCVYTNKNFLFEVMDIKEEDGKEGPSDEEKN
mmetsp:Transcript_12632/g.16022  ORF Transcript_12632/g.16022 Transcript_12632/m.16022 type:complete len:258 (-) Transcript_12632:33-806(-)